MEKIAGAFNQNVQEASSSKIRSRDITSFERTCVIPPSIISVQERESSASVFPIVKPLVDFAQMFVADMGINLGGADILVAEQ